MVKGEPVNVLLVEDNPDHVEIVVRNLKEHRIANRINVVMDGEEALDYLFGRGAYVDRDKYPMPHVVLLDLRLPKVDGLQVLKVVKSSEELKHIPVVILTTSEAEFDVAKAYEYHANSYLVKPVDYEKFMNLLKDMGFYWLGWNFDPWTGRDDEA
jgi:CheY-like chemotaxis protein